MLLAIILGYPCVCFSSRKALMFVLFSHDEHWTLLRHILVTLAIVGITLTMAMLIPDLKTALAWIGATISVLMMYVFPSLAFLSVWKSLPDQPRRRALKARAVLVWGLVVMCACVANNILNPPNAPAAAPHTSPLPSATAQPAAPPEIPVKME